MKPLIFKIDDSDDHPLVRVVLPQNASGRLRKIVVSDKVIAEVLIDGLQWKPPPEFRIYGDIIITLEDHP